MLLPATSFCYCEERSDEAISEGEILNSKHQIPNLKQYQMTKPKSKTMSNYKAQMSNQAQNLK
jgi:hypothetical protein